ncbi:hypothetical protein ON010_g6040 [Phytophthora cinnamomi]|nr:hypothetical protein ON010_g6040 [Phytophthora cinnamomi]
MLAIAYPTFGAVFNQLAGYWQTAFVFILPVIKFFIKQYIAKVSAHLHEYVGPTVVLSVDVCNVLYVAICVQAAVSPITLGLLIASDALFVILALRSIYYQSDVSQARQRALSMHSKLSTNLKCIHNLRALLRDAFHGQDTSGDAQTPIRIHAPFPLPLSNESMSFLNELDLVRRRYSVEAGGAYEEPNTAKSVPRRESVNGQCNLQRTSSKSTTTSKTRSTRNSQEQLEIPPLPYVGTKSATDATEVTAKRSASAFNSATRTKRSSISGATSRSESYYHQTVVADVQDSLQALFHSEYVILAEFIEWVIPILYGTYLAVLYHLPTAAPIRAHSLEGNL